MDIKLKSVKHFPAGSAETECFKADVYIDGRKAGYAENEGQGGPTWIHPATLRDRLQAHAATLPDCVSSLMLEGKPFTYRPNAESVIDDLLAEYLEAKDLRRKLARRIVFMRDGKLLETKELSRADREHWLANPEQFKAQVILNQLPEAEAFRILRGAQQ